jgi:hypothetical protein
VTRFWIVAAVVSLLAAPASAEAALSIAVASPTVAMSLQLGHTATATSSVVVSPAVGTWQLSVADLTGHAGHLAKAATCPSYAAAQTANALSITASGPLPTTTSNGTKTVGSSSQLIASGTLTDTVSLSLSLGVLGSELLPVGCTYSTTLTYTLQ